MDHRARLESVRDALDLAITNCESNRDLPGLCREYRAVLGELSALADPAEVDPVDELSARREDRRSTG